MRDGSRWVMNKDKAAGMKEEPKQARRIGRRLLQDMLSAVPDEALPAQLVSAIKVCAPCAPCCTTKHCEAGSGPYYRRRDRIF